MLMSGLTSQIAEMKIKFDEIEKARTNIEKEREKLNAERDQRIKDWADGTGRLFKEMNEKGDSTANEKEKRIESWMEATRKFFTDQKKTTEDFLIEQAKGRESIETQRDAQIQDMKKMIETFTRTIAGTKTRGMVGEEMLNEVLSHSIQAGVVVKDLKVENGVVEFAWKLDENTYIPIDAKLPDIFELVEKFNSLSDVNEQRKCRKKIGEKIEKEVEAVRKYQNFPNTTDCCMLVAPQAVLEIAPEIVSFGKNFNVYVCTYTDVFAVAYILEERYHRLKEQGDAGKWRLEIERLRKLLDEIFTYLDTVERGVTMVTNAKDGMRELIMGSRERPGIPSTNMEDEQKGDK